MKKRLAFLIVGLLLLLAILLATRIRRVLPGATVIKLVSGCQATLMDTRLQPVFTMSLDCPGVDSIRIWPLPVVQPFMEDWHETRPEGELISLQRYKKGTDLYDLKVLNDLYILQEALEGFLWADLGGMLWTV
jgi:hypothetical protein